LSVQSSSGDVILGDTHLNALLGGDIGSGPGAASGQFYPASLLVRSLSGDVGLPVSVTTLYPSSTGQLEVLAGRDINKGGSLFMSDAFLDNVPTVQSPGTSSAAPLAAGFESNAHSADILPALIAAGRDIDTLTLSVPKATDILAGRDISNLLFRGENLSAGDVTLISAGRDFIDTLNDTGGVGAIVQVGGPGKLDILAGRDVSLGLSLGVVTTGNLTNPNLPTATGADLSVMAGLGQSPDYGTFLAKIVAPTPDNRAALVDYLESQTGESDLSFADAQAEFAQLGATQQRDFLNGLFFSELGLSGAEANSVGYARGYAAIDALFPNSRTAVATGASPYEGNVDLTFSRMYTLSGGTISIFAPGGLLNVGLANPPASLAALATKKPSELGIVAQGPGDVDIYTKGDVLVNNSRIFTLGGGNILLWSDEGNIDAGRGAKSSTSAPPPQILVDAQGNVTLDFQGAVSGSGIRTIQIDRSVNAGNVTLIAPLGTINAGDAGIGAAGNITLAAQHVLGLDNIQFGGQAVGVPPQVSDLGVSLASVANVASSASNSATGAVDESARRNETAAPLAQAAISWLDVFVTGLGEENCRPDDLTCLQRQKAH
jgi:hypothetical protein